MTGRLFLHIGPPKTATTSLQAALEALVHPRYAYAGVYQPRERNEGSLASHLHHAVLGNTAATQNAVEGIESLLSAGKVVLLSEEMLSLEQQGITTEAKIARLGEILTGIETTMVVTLRSPTEGLASLYQELYPGLPLDLQLDFTRFCISGRSQCFDYMGLKEDLELVGLEDIRWLNFSSILGGALTTRDIFGQYDLWNGEALSLPQLNVSAQGAGGGRKLPGVNAKAIGRHPYVRRVIDSTGLRGGGLIRIAGTLLERVPLRRPRSQPLVVPEPCAEALTKGYEALLRQEMAQG